MVRGLFSREKTGKSARFFSKSTGLRSNTGAKKHAWTDNPCVFLNAGFIFHCRPG